MTFWDKLSLRKGGDGGNQSPGLDFSPTGKKVQEEGVEVWLKEWCREDPTQSRGTPTGNSQALSKVPKTTGSPSSTMTFPRAMEGESSSL